MKKAIFFDLDGTLWDAIEEIKDSYNLAMEEHNLSYRFNYDLTKSFMGLTPEETALLVFKDVSLEKGMEYFKLCLKKEIDYLASHPGKLYPHEMQVLEKLAKKYDLYIVSNADQGYIENYLKIEEVKPFFKGHLCAGDTKKDKWFNILKVKNDNLIDEVIYVGDTNKDKIQSEKAGVKFIHAAYGFDKIPNYPYKIDSLLELEELVDKLFN